MSALNWDSTKFQDRAIGTLILAVQIKVLFEEFHSQLFLMIHLIENLKIADVGYGIGSKILRVKFEKVKNVSEELWAGGEKPRFMWSEKTITSPSLGLGHSSSRSGAR